MVPAQEVGDDVSDSDAKRLIDQQETIDLLKADVKKYKRQRNIAVAFVGIAAVAVSVGFAV